MMLVYLDEKAWANMAETEREAAMNECKPYAAELAASGKFFGGAPLHPTTTASTIRAREGKKLVTGGPFAETREQLGGYGLIEAKDDQEAIEIASGFLGYDSKTTIEVRRIVALGDSA